MVISLFITCYNDLLFPATGKAVTAVLERLGHRVEFRAAQTCCGQMHQNTGYTREALALLRGFVRTFRDAEVICSPSASCVAMIREQYPAIAANASDGALQTAVASLVPRVYEFSELLVNRLGVEEVGACFPHRVTFHPSCHSLRSLRCSAAQQRLLNRVSGLEMKPLRMHTECCGFGGTFAVKNADVSAAMLEEKIENIVGSGAEFCAAGDNSCLMQIEGGLRRRESAVRTIHLAEILACSQGGQP